MFTQASSNKDGAFFMYNIPFLVNCPPLTL